MQRMIFKSFIAPWNDSKLFTISHFSIEQVNYNVVKSVIDSITQESLPLRNHYNAVSGFLARGFGTEGQQEEYSNTDEISK